MGERLDFEIVDLPNATIEDEAIRSLPSRFVYRNHLAPIARENGTLKVATSDPFDLYVFDEIKLLTGLRSARYSRPGTRSTRSSRITTASAATRSRR